MENALRGEEKRSPLLCSEGSGQEQNAPQFDSSTLMGAAVYIALRNQRRLKRIRITAVNKRDVGRGSIGLTGLFRDDRRWKRRRRVMKPINTVKRVTMQLRTPRITCSGSVQLFWLFWFVSTVSVARIATQ
jgi:hypothetical protein